MPQIDYFFATTSPFTYLAGTRLEEIAGKHGASITYKPVDVIGLFGRTGGTPPKDRHPNRQAYRLRDLDRTAKKNGMPINVKPAHWPTNPAPSAYAIIAAAKEGEVGDLAHAFARACWAEERDVAQDDVIREVLEANGFDPAIADRGMMTAADTYSRNLEEAVAAGAFGAPFYVVDGTEPFWGQDRLEDLDLYLSGKL